MLNELFQEISNIISNIGQIISSNADLVNTYSSVFSDIVLGGVALIGIKYLKPLKEKSLLATFSTWRQFETYLVDLEERISADYGLLDNMYSPESKQGWDATISPTPQLEYIAEFKSVVAKTIKFMEETPDQMPIYVGWSEDYHKLLCYLKDMIVYDICDATNHFKFFNETTATSRQEYCEGFHSIVVEMKTHILEKQKALEKKIVKKKRRKVKESGK